MVLAVGLAEHFCGYFGLWLAATGRLALPYFGTVCLAVMAFNGANWVDTACIATNIRNFPAHRGNVVGGPPCSLLSNWKEHSSVHVQAHTPHSASRRRSVDARFHLRCPCLAQIAWWVYWACQ